MITGTVSNHRALVEILVRGPGGQEAQVEFVIDTGFTGVITLPPMACAALALPFIRPQPANLAEGSRVLLEVFECTLLWDNVERDVEVLSLDGAPLIGMTLLEGSDVQLQITEGGLITIELLLL